MTRTSVIVSLLLWAAAVLFFVAVALGWFVTEIIIRLAF